MLHNNSPRTVAEKQTELESSDRPGDRSRRKCVKDIRERRLLEFGGFGIESKWCCVRKDSWRAGLKERTRNSVLYVRRTKRELLLHVRRR